MDLYVLRSFLWNYLLFLFVLLGLFITIDTVVKFDEFVEITGHEGVRSVENAVDIVLGMLDYYRFQVFRIFGALGGLVPVVAASFTLMRMSRNNELVAMLGAGVHLLRVAAPILFAALVLNLVLLPINQELIVPKLFPELTRERGAQISLGAGQPLRAIPDGEDKVLYAGAFHPISTNNPQPSMDVVDIIEFGPQNVTFLRADRAVWNPAKQQWDLENGRLQPGMWAGKALPDTTAVSAYKGTITPETISLSLDGQFVDLLSSARISQLIAAPNAVGLGDLLRVRDSRWAGFLLNIVLVGLTIPAVLTREPLQLRTATMRVFTLVGLCLASAFISQSLAGQPAPNPAWAMTWPAIMSFTPVVVFALVAVLMLDRIRS